MNELELPRNPTEADLRKWLEGKRTISRASYSVAAHRFSDFFVGLRTIRKLLDELGIELTGPNAL